MENLIKRLFGTALSLISTCLIMAMPVAVMIYALEPVTTIESVFSIRQQTTSSATTAKIQGEAEPPDLPWLIDKTEEFSPLTWKE